MNAPEGGLTLSVAVPHTVPGGQRRLDEALDSEKADDMEMELGGRSLASQPPLQVSSGRPAAHACMFVCD